LVFCLHWKDACTTAIEQYDGLKYSGDEYDALHLAHLLRLGILRTGYIYPKEMRRARPFTQAQSAGTYANDAYLGAFVEAAHFALRYNAAAKRFYERKKAKTNAIVATKALAHKLARACYFTH
jgi:hypothetical protein